MSKKLLAVMRHGEAVSMDLSSTGSDIERGLTSHGARQAESIGKYFKNNDIIFDLVICSSAERTRSTWDSVKKFYDIDVDILYEKSLYYGDENEYYKLIRRTDEDISNLLIIGHNPNIYHIINSCSADGDIIYKITPSSVGFLTFDTSWHKFDARHSNLNKLINGDKVGV